MLRLAFFTLRIRFRCRSQCRYRLREGSLACRRCFISSCFAFRRTVLARIARRTACRAKRRVQLLQSALQCRRAVVQGFTVLIQLPGSVLHLIHGVPQGRHTIGKFIQILVEIFEAVIELPDALIHIIHAVLQIIHAVRKIVGVLQVVRVQILQQSRCNDGSRKLQLEIFGVCAHFHILWNVDVLGHLIAGQLQTVR